MKEPYDFHNPNLLGVAEQIKRLRPLRQVMEQADCAPRWCRRQ